MNQRILSYIDYAILFLLTIQISVVSLSIAVSSIAFGCWIALWLFQLVLSKNLKINKNAAAQLKWISIFTGLYILFEVISRFFAVYPEGAFDNLKRMMLFLIFFVSVIKITGTLLLKKIFLVLIGFNAVVSVYELVQYALQFNELTGSMPFSEIRIDYFSYPITGAEIKMMVILSVFPLIFVKETVFISRYILIALVVPIFLSMLLTQSRNVYLAVFVCFLIYGMISNRTFLIVLLLVIIAAGIFLPAQYTDRVKSIVDLTHTSNSSRISMWKVGFQMFKDHPFTGVADSHIKEIYQTYKTIETPGEGVHLHNNFLMILATTGIFGFLSYMGIFISIFSKQVEYFIRQKDKTFKMLTLGSILVMISFHISGIFEWNFGDHEVVTVFFFLIAVPFIINDKPVK